MARHNFLGNDPFCQITEDALYCAGRPPPRIKRLYFQRKLLPIVLVLFGLIVGGTLGYSYLEEWPILDSLYMTMVILSTVGLGANRELHEAGKLFTILLITFGAVTGAWAVNAIGQRILENQLGDYFGRRKMEKETKRLQGHYIV
jgi:voltage-gated potassium channel